MRTMYFWKRLTTTLRLVLQLSQIIIATLDRYQVVVGIRVVAYHCFDSWFARWEESLIVMFCVERFIWFWDCFCVKNFFDIDNALASIHVCKESVSDDVSLTCTKNTHFKV